MKETKLTISNKKMKVELPLVENLVMPQSLVFNPFPMEPMSVPVPLRTLVYDSNTNQLALGQMGDAAFNGNRTITASGIPAINPGGLTVGQFLNNWLFPALGPIASISITDPIRESGDGRDLDYSWAVTKRTNPINNIKVEGIDQTITGETQSGIGVTVFGSTTVVISASDVNGLSNNASASVSYLPARFYGTSARDHNQMVLALLGGTAVETVAPEFSKQLATDYRVNQNYNCTGGRYIHVLFPASFGTPTLVRSGLLDFSAYTLSPVSTTDVYGISRSYKLLTTFIQNGASVNINIVN